MCAHTTAFLPKPNLDLKATLGELSLLEDVGIRHLGDGRIALFALEGANAWPCEWTPEGDELEDFDIEALVSRLAAGGQTIDAVENGQVISIGLGLPA